MIIDKEIEVKIHRANIRFYKEKYNCKVNDFILVNISDLPIGVTIPLLVKCDLCDNEKKLGTNNGNLSINLFTNTKKY